MSEPVTARAWLDAVLDGGWTSLFDEIVSTDPLGFPGYRGQLEGARTRSGASESVVVADGAIDGRPVVALAFEFGFLGGSMGVAAGERICRAFERGATLERPVVALTASGGARMQEGMLALAQMPATMAARARLATAHQPFIAYLRNPTTGGVFASFANSADVVWAQPGATIGFAGPRVAETVTGMPLPEGSHTAESAYAAHLVDGLVAPGDVARRLADLLALLATPPRAHDEPIDPPRALGGVADAWDQVRLARHPQRPTGSDYVDLLVPLNRGGAPDPTIETGIARVAGEPVVVIAQDRQAGTGRPSPAAFRRARAAIATAERLGLPIVTFVDTPGAEPGARAERMGIAAEISETFAALLGARVPTIACVVGEGGSGGALAFAAADRILIQENAIFSVIAPEGAASILRRTDVDQVARDLRLTAQDLLLEGFADAEVPEPIDGAHNDPQRARELVEHAIAWALQDLRHDAPPREVRLSRWRAGGRP